MSPASGRTLTCPHTWLQEEEILLSPLHKVTPSLGRGGSPMCAELSSGWCPAAGAQPGSEWQRLWSARQTAG